MVPIVTLFWNICILRIGPESVPARVWFAVVLLLADMAASLIEQQILNPLLPEADRVPMLKELAFNLLHIAGVAALTRIAFHLRGLDRRFLATFTALLGTHLLITVLIVAVAQLSSLAGLSPLILAGVLQIWWIVVWGFICQRAFDTTLLIGIPVAFVIVILAYLVSLAIFGFIGIFA